MDWYGCLPIKLYWQKEVVGQNCPIGQFTKPWPNYLTLILKAWKRRRLERRREGWAGEGLWVPWAAGSGRLTAKAPGSMQCFLLLFPTFDQVPSILQCQEFLGFKTGEDSQIQGLSCLASLPSPNFPLQESRRLSGARPPGLPHPYHLFLFCEATRWASPRDTAWKPRQLLA